MPAKKRAPSSRPSPSSRGRSRRAAPPPVRIGEAAVEPGTQHTVEIPVARLPTGTWMSLPVTAVNGVAAGPRLWLSAAIHGDELNGVEIIRRVLEEVDARHLTGAVVAVPVVNVFGFVGGVRYLPDRRDLNRSFPGSPRGSMAARLADLFMREVVNGSAFGIDFHTGAVNRANLPQIRGDMTDPETARYARAFGAPVTLQARTRDGSLRAAAVARGARVLVFEGGEALRFTDAAIETGVAGTLRLMRALGMIAHGPAPARGGIVCTTSSWVRARRSGVTRLSVGLGDRVEKDQALGVIRDTTGGTSVIVRAPFAGVVIGRTLNPLTSRGDALLHLGAR